MLEQLFIVFSENYTPVYPQQGTRHDLSNMCMPKIEY